MKTTARFCHFPSQEPFCSSLMGILFSAAVNSLRYLFTMLLVSFFKCIEVFFTLSISSWLMPVYLPLIVWTEKARALSQKDRLKQGQTNIGAIFTQPSSHFGVNFSVFGYLWQEPIWFPENQIAETYFDFWRTIFTNL